MLARCGRAAHICEANCICNKFFLLQLQFLKLSNSNNIKSWESTLQIRTRQRGNCSTLAGKSRGGTPFCRTLKISFSKSIVSRETIEAPVATVPPEQLQDNRLLLRFHKAERSCSPRLEKLSLFSPPAPCAKSMARGFRCLRAAIRATRPEPRQHFWKIAGSKNFLFLCSAQMIQPIFHPANSPYLWQSFCIVSRDTMLLENQLRAVRQNRFAVCLCAVRRWLCCPNWLWIFLRLLFSGNFFASWMANSIYLLLLDCNTV